MAKNVIAIDGDTGKAIAALKELGQQVGGLDKALALIGKTAQACGGNVEQMGGQAKRIFNETRTAAERYEQKLGQLNKLLESGKINQDTYNRAVGDAKRNLDSAGKAHESAFGATALRTVQTLAGAFGVGLGLAGAIGLARKEYEAFIETQRRAGQTSLTEAEAQSEAFVNLRPKTDKERESFVKQIDALSAETGVSRRDLYLRASSALSARGNAPISDAMEAVRVSALMFPGNAQVGKLAAGTALDIKNAEGGTLKGNMALLAAIGDVARPSDPGKIADALGPVITAGRQYGMNARDSGSLWAALTTGIGGENSSELARTAAVNLHRRLEEFLPDKDAYSKTEADPLAKRKFDEAARRRRKEMDERIDAALFADPEYKAGMAGFEARQLAMRRHGRPRPGDDELRRKIAQDEDELTLRIRGRLTTTGPLAEEITALDTELIAKEAALPKKVETKATGLKTSGERLAYLQSHPELRAKFMEDAELGRGAVRPAVQDLLTPGTATAGAFAQFPSRIPYGAQAEAEFDTTLAVRRRDPLQQIAAISRRVKSTRERLQAANTGGATQGVLRDELVGLLEDTGLGGFASKMKGLMVEGTTGPTLPAVVGELQTRKKQLEHPMQYAGGVVEAEGALAQVPREQTALEKTQVQVLGQAVEALNKLVELQKASNAEQQRKANPTLARPNEDK